MFNRMNDSDNIAKPALRQSPCVCADPFGMHSLAERLHGRHVIAYLRGDSQNDVAEQRREISNYCDLHGYRLVGEYVDYGPKPLTGLAEAEKALDHADAIIVADLDRLVAVHKFRERELRPLLHQFLCKGGKHIITIAEGINTGTLPGQIAAMEYITQLKDAEHEFDSIVR